MKRLFRDRWDKKLAGVCGGLGVYFNIDPTIIRLVFATVSVFTLFLPALVGYLLLYLLVPLGPKNYIQPSCKKLYRSRRNRKIAGVCGGLGEFFSIDPTLIRVGVVVTIFFSFGTTALLYVIYAFIIPEKHSKN